MKKKVRWSCLILLLLVHPFSGRAEPPEPELRWAKARVADASDRAYEKIAVWLVDQAKESVALSLYLIRESDQISHPVNLLLNDLLEALERGVRVEIFLNTKFKAPSPEEILGAPLLNRLKGSGAEVVGLPRSRRLHDKLLVVDERFVLEGSSNWSVEALKNNWESNTLIDSPELAGQKLNRLRQLTETPEDPPPSSEPVFPKTVEVPLGWLKREGPFPRMIQQQDERGLNLTLLLLREAAKEASWQFFVSLEELGLDLHTPSNWDDTTTRRQVIKALRRLQTGYRLIDLTFTHGKDAWVKLLIEEGLPTVSVPLGEWPPDRLSRQPAALTYLLLLQHALRQSEGLELSQLSQKELVSRTGLSRKLLRRTLLLLSAFQRG